MVGIVAREDFLDSGHKVDHRIGRQKNLPGHDERCQQEHEWGRSSIDGGALEASPEGKTDHAQVNTKHVGEDKG